VFGSVAWFYLKSYKFTAQILGHAHWANPVMTKMEEFYKPMDDFLIAMEASHPNPIIEPPY